MSKTDDLLKRARDFKESFLPLDEWSMRHATSNERDLYKAVSLIQELLDKIKGDAERLESKKFMVGEYGAKFVTVGKIESLSDKPPEPPPLPQAWSGMYQGRKRDAMYYEKCLKDIRDGIKKLVKKNANHEMKIIFMQGLLSNILSHEYELDGVDLDKPNYGMF